MNNIKTIAILNHKGGVGKTTIAMNFGAELGKLGFKVLLIDFDSQSNLTKSTCVDNSFNKTIADAIAEIISGNFDTLEVHEYIYETVINSHVEIIPSSIKLADVQEALHYAVAREQILKILVDKIKGLGVYDYIVIDNAPSVGVDFQNVCVASDEILIVTEPRDFSADGMDSLINNTNKVKRFLNANLRIKGILINNVDMRTNMTKAMVDFIDNKYKDQYVFNSFIPSSVKIAESQFMNTCISDYDKNNSAAKAMIEFTKEYIRCDK